MNEPSLLLCDEPTGNLDTKTSGAIGDLLHSVTGRAGAMLVVVTHSAALAESFPRRLRMADGQLLNQ
jgi:ABC-type lipoprotein export system ATPase subunit